MCRKRKGVCWDLRDEARGATTLDVEAVASLCQQITRNVGQVIVGKADAVELMLLALLSEGHVLVEDVPGVGKTILARAMAISLGCSFGRIQCTPDLLPSDVTGVSVYDPSSGQFVFRPGPVVSQILLADEINRATPRTQSSLLECMAEGQITVDGKTRRLPRPFLVMATQNPIEYEGTFPLPEAQLDRFFLRLKLGYPDETEESEILLRLQYDHPIDAIEACTEPETFVRMQEAIKGIYVEDSVREYIVRLTGATRRHSDVVLGASPRGSLALFRAGQALAALRGRDYVLPDDIKHVAIPVLGHRLILKPESQLRGRAPEHVIQELLHSTAVKFEEIDNGT
ncbi:MAG: MoxR family ATPase [Firmicutes bacterium]|nr:MoxR family ATPase [Bacillota bacterium]